MPALRAAANSLEFRLAPNPPGRFSAVQWTTVRPAARAARTTVVTCPIRSTLAPASARAGNPDSGPTTPRWTSCTSTAVPRRVDQPGQAFGLLG